MHVCRTCNGETEERVGTYWFRPNSPFPKVSKWASTELEPTSPGTYFCSPTSPTCNHHGQRQPGEVFLIALLRSRRGGEACWKPIIAEKFFIWSCVVIDLNFHFLLLFPVHKSYEYCHILRAAWFGLSRLYVPERWTEPFPALPPFCCSDSIPGERVPASLASYSPSLKLLTSWMHKTEI